MPRLRWHAVVAIAIDGRHHRWEMCGCEHFRIHPFMKYMHQTTDNIKKACLCLLLNARQHLLLPQTWSESLQTRSRMRACVSGRIHVVRVHSWTLVDTFTDTSVSAHLFCTYNHFLLVSPANGGRKAESSWLSQRYPKCQVDLIGACCQVTINSYNWASANN